MVASFEYLRKGHGIPDSQLLGISSPDGFFFFLIQTFHLEEMPKHVAKRPAPAHSHNVFHLVLYTADSENNHFMLNGKETDSGPGMLVMTSPRDSHSFSPLNPGRTSYHELTFSLENPDGSFMGDWTQLMAFYSGDEKVCIPPLTTLDCGMMLTLEKHFLELSLLLQNIEDGNHMAALNGVMDILLFLHGELFARKDFTRKDKSLENVRRHIEKHFKDDLDLKGLGRRFSMSHEHLCRRFKAVYGISPLKFAMDLKISAAKNMLIHSEQSIKEISNSLGFSDVYAFSKSFRKNASVPPGKYRNDILQMP